MTHFFSILIAAAILVATNASAQSYQTAVAELTIKDDASGRDLEGFVWYPTTQTTGITQHHGNPVWAAIEAINDAPAAPGEFPLVVLSHGMYGNAMNQAWLASDLSKRGYIVAAISHPGTSTWSRDLDDARQMWERPKDISRVIDHLTAHNLPAVHVDPQRIYMAGHSLGGFTAVALAGGRYDAAKFDATCARPPGETAGDVVCDIFGGWSVAKTPEDRERIQADLSDPRIKRFALFDVGGTQAFSEESLGAISRPFLVFGAPRNINGTGLNLDIESRALIAALPKTNVTYLEPETLAHFDFLSECNPNALTILEEEEPDDVFVCIEGREERQAEHKMIADEVARFFDQP